MNLSPQRFREMLFLLLFASEKGENQGNFQLVMELLKVSRRPAKIAQEKVSEILPCLSEIDQKISNISTEYQIHRISQVEKTALRLAVYEFFFEKELPAKIILSEALRLTSKYGTAKGADFVNALLDILMKDEFADSNHALSV